MSIPTSEARSFGTWRENLVEFVAAGSAIVAPFHFFRRKTALQLNRPVPPFAPFSALQAGCKAAPVTGLLIGSQRVTQIYFQQELDTNTPIKHGFASAFLSAAGVGIVTTPLLAIFNGLTQGKSVRSSLKDLTPKTAAAGATMEVGFLAGMGAADVLKRKAGNNKAIEYFSAFLSGALGALTGHAGDTALTLWQNRLKIERIPQLMKGSFNRAMGVGFYVLLNKTVKESLSH